MQCVHISTFLKKYLKYLRKYLRMVDFWTLYLDLSSLNLELLTLFPEGVDEVNIVSSNDLAIQQH